MIEQRVTLRYGAQQIPAIVQAVQGDTGRDVIFELADYEIPAGATANYYIDKPDDTAIYNSAEVISSTEILAHLTEQALAAPGRNNGQVRILSDDEVITSFDFVLEVEVFRGLMRMQSETEVNIFDEALQAAAEDAIEEIQAQTPVVTGMQNSIAPTYSSSSTYAVGDYVMYNAQLYRCITAITASEAWTAAHWTQVPIASDVNVLKSALTNYEEISIEKYSSQYTNKYIDKTDGTQSSNDNHRMSPFIPVYPGMKIAYNLYATPYAFIICSYSKAQNQASSYVSRSGIVGNGSNTPNTGVYIVPDGGNFIRFCFAEVHRSQCYVRAYVDDILLAKEFDATVRNEIGEYTKKNGEAYRFIGVHSAGDAWDSSIVAKVDNISNDIATRLKTLDNYYGSYLGEIFNINVNNVSRVGYYIDKTDGIATANNTYRISNYIPVSSGLDLAYCFYGTSYAALICCYKSEDVSSPILDSIVVGGGENVKKEGIYTVPADAKYMRFCYAISKESNCYIKLELPESAEIKELNNYANNNTQYNEMVNDDLFFRGFDRDAFSYVEKFIDKTDGMQSTNSDHRMTGFIRVVPGMKIRYRLCASTSAAVIYAYTDATNASGISGSGVNAEGYNTFVKGVYTVPENANYIRICTLATAYRFANSYFYLDNPWMDNYRYFDWIIRDNQYAIDLIRNSRKYKFNASSSETPPFTLLHFSDIHGTKDSLERIIQFKKHMIQEITDVICTGDMVQRDSDRDGGFAYWGQTDGAESILLTIGNHDLSLTGDGTLTIAEQYEMYFAPYISNWSAQINENKTWYYKDYATQKIRLICLGSSYTMPTASMNEQISWLDGVLSSAITDGYSVIIAQHYLPEDAMYQDCNFTSIPGQSTPTLYINASLLSSIDAFIENGGKFICHICGHTHKDFIARSDNHHEQLFICVTDASSNEAQNYLSDQARYEDTKSIDAFNVLTVDVNRKLIKVVRIGADIDMYLRSRKCIVFDYENNEIVYQG